jgi:hypothetical protein
MNEVRMPIQTVRDGNKITKTCVEDVYKIVNRVIDSMDKAYNKAVDIIDSLVKIVPAKDENGNDIKAEGYLVIGAGISQPCMTDAFDEEIGSNLAFIKMKLNANIKKHNFLVKIYNNYYHLLKEIDKELIKIDDTIRMDLEGVRKHNSDYLPDIENKLGL